MAKQSNDQDLFNLDLETQDIKLPGDDDIAIRVPSPTQTKPGQGTQKAAGGPPSIRGDMLEGAQMPPLIAVDVEEGDIPQPGAATTAPPVKKPEPEKKETPPAAGETKPAETEKTDPPPGTEKTTPPATQGQQGEPGKGTESEENLSPTYLHAAALHEAGALPNLDLETLKELEPDAILNKINEHTLTQQNDQVEARVEAYKNQFNDEQKKVMDMFDEGIPFDDAANVVYNQQRYDGLDEAQIKESPEIQEQLYREFLYAKGHNDTFINRAIKQSKELEQLESDGLSSHKDLAAMAKEEEEAIRENAKSERATRKKNNEESLKRIKTDVTATKEILTGVPLTKADQDKVLEIMTVPSAEVMQGGKKVMISKVEEKRRENPLEFAKRQAYYVHLGLFDDNPKLDIVEKKGETDAINKLKGVLEGGGAPSGGGKPTISDKDTKNVSGQPADVEIRMPKQINTVRHND